MSAWNRDELAAIGDAQLLELSSRRPDGSLRPGITMWVVGVDDDLYVRSAHGPDNPWYVRARSSGTGRIRAGGMERDVVFADPDSGVDEAIDAAYHAKYDRHGPQIVGTVVGPDVHPLTIRLAPANTGN
ncbi:MAG: DUF2255 family protein [Acidimicrobiia bacterium]